MTAMTDRQPPKRRPSACLPCHQRKVRCDAATIGTPCSRCVSKDASQHCTLVPPRGSGRGSTRSQNDTYRRQKDRRSLARDSNGPHSSSTDVSPSFGTITLQQHERQPLRARQNGPIQFHEAQGLQTGIPESYPSISTPSPAVTGQLQGSTHNSIETYAISEEDAHVQTLHRMTDGNNPLSAPIGVSDEPHNYDLVEYFDSLNSVSILGEALGRRQTRRLIQLNLSRPQYVSAEQRELSNLDPPDVAYLYSREVFVKPPKPACISLVRLWFKHVYPYTPVLDRAHFYEDFVRDECSHFLLYAILANVVPYASQNLIEGAGYSDRSAAQRDFSSKAQLLHDFGCERRQMVLLQGSCILSSFQASYAPTKDFRFWLHNAFRIATQMGLHRQNLEDDLDPRTYRLCRKIWWMIYARDVLFNLSGFSNSRCVDDREVDIYPLHEHDWHEEQLTKEAESLLGLTTNIQKAYFTHNCQLASLGGKFLRFSRNSTSPISQSDAMGYVEEFSAWRNELPEEFSTNRVSSWTSDNVWILFLLAFSYRLECLFYRTAREHFRKSNDGEGVSWCKKQLTGCVFELDTLMSRAIEHDLVKYAPASLIVCACNLLAFQMETALDEESSPSRKFTAKARINALLAYFQETGESWQMANWTFRVSEWVVKRAGLKMDVGAALSEDISRTSQQQSRNWNSNEHQSSAVTAIPAPLGPFFSSESLFAFGDAFPDPWLQDLFGDSSYGQPDSNVVDLGQGQ